MSKKKSTEENAVADHDEEMLIHDEAEATVPPSAETIEAANAAIVEADTSNPEDDEIMIDADLEVVFKGERQLLDQFRARMSRDPYDAARQERTHERWIV